MTRQEFENEVLEIADYLGCNGKELLNEMKTLVAKLSPTYWDESLIDPTPPETKESDDE